MQSTSWEMPYWMNHSWNQDFWGIINNFRYADDTVIAESKEQLKSLLMRVKRSQNAGLELSIQRTKIMASSLITSWQTEGKKVETVTVFIFFFWSPKSLWMVTIAIKLKDSIPPWKESFNKPGRHIKQQRHHFAGKGLYSQSCDFSSSCVWM